MNKDKYSVEILTGGRPVREFNQYINGEYKTFIEGRKNSEYSIRINNHSNQKLLAISTVDGLNVVSGKISDGYKGRGYIIQPYDNVIIKGFRESDSTVRAFKFTNKDNSYASEKGFERNCGIIAVNLIAEKIQPIKEIHHHHDHYIDRPYPVPTPYPEPWPKPYDPWPRWICSSGGTSGYSGSSGSTGSSNNIYAGNELRSFSNSSDVPIVANFMEVERKASFDLGTSWGTRVEDKIIHKHFDKGIVVANFNIYYASRFALESMGIQFHPEKQIDWPQGFEGEYCKPPKSWC